MEINRQALLILCFILIGCTSQKEEQFYENGNLRVSASIEDGKRNGLVQFFYESGSLQIEQMWKQGTENGFSRKYYEKGQLMQVDTFCMGTPCGLSIAYYPDGQVKSQGKYVDGLPFGSHVFFYPNGDTLEVDYFNHEGKIFDFEKYGKDGKILSDKKVGFFFLENDTVKKGEAVKLIAYMGNNQSRTRLIIGSEFLDQTILKDTIGFYFPVSESDDGITYQRTAEKAGSYQINGVIQDKVGIGEYVKIRSIPFSYGYLVEE